MHHPVTESQRYRNRRYPMRPDGEKRLSKLIGLPRHQRGSIDL